GNLHFPGAPGLDALKSMLDAYSISIGEAKDGSRRAILQRNQQGEEVIRLLQVLAGYGEIHCKADIHIFLTSGFQARSYTSSTRRPLDTPSIIAVNQGPTGTLMARLSAVRRAKTYELRYGALGADGAAPTLWSTHTVGNAKSAASIAGLTPGITYTIQVRA